MPIAPPSPPDGLLDETLRVAEDLLPDRLHDISPRWITYQASKTSVVPRRLYILSLDSLLNGDGFAAAEANGWRSLVILDGVAVALADADVNEDTATIRAMNYGPFVQGVFEAGVAYDLSDDHRHAAVDGGSPEQRILQISALYFTGLWMHDDANPQRDTLIPIAPAPAGLAANRSRDAREVLQVLRQYGHQKRQQ
ncbi:hypothetical protein EV580_6571 [Mycobacterium sp. BK086]|uniref:hypothetical protein n=1 Tax=Mycobacterium sp. BK086 TaxID=2512165 RepID=UPI0010619DEA|nr:hypothetical protein [Mycobacterium sp. BK086]TDO06480.1 hypothetical protein EV580_6571 [Mycobacterium sp. BK086]